MKQQLEAIQKQALDKLTQISEIRELEDLKVAYLGKKGELTRILKGMGALTAEERPIIGQMANEVRTALEESIANTRARLVREERNKRLKDEVIDVTLPGKIRAIGKTSADIGSG